MRTTLEAGSFPLEVPWALGVRAGTVFHVAGDAAAQRNDVGTVNRFLRRLIRLLSRLRVVLLHGGDAQKSWRRFTRTHPDVADGAVVVNSYHTSQQAFWHPDPAERVRRLNKLRDDLAGVAAILRTDDAQQQ